MEDNHIIEDFPELTSHTLVAIMDGHAGDGAALYTGYRLREVIEESDSWKEYVGLKDKTTQNAIDILSKALVGSFVTMDYEIRSVDFMVSKRFPQSLIYLRRFLIYSYFLWYRYVGYFWLYLRLCCDNSYAYRVC